MLKKTLKSRFDNFSKLLNDNSTFFCGDALDTEKARDKIFNAKAAFAENCSEDPILIIDSTVWGSFDEGVLLTENNIYFKSQFEDPGSFYLDELSTVFYSPEDRELNINGSKVKFFSSDVDGKLQRVVQELNEHITGFGIKHDAQKGKKQYLNNLIEQVSGIQNSIGIWADGIEMRAYSIIGDFVNSGASFGGEGFFERQSIKLARSRSADKFQEMTLEVYQKILSTNSLNVIKNCNQEFKDQGQEKFDANPNFHMYYFVHKDLSNQNWDSEMTEGFEKLILTARDLASSLNELKDRLNLLTEDED